MEYLSLIHISTGCLLVEQYVVGNTDSFGSREEGIVQFRGQFYQMCIRDRSVVYRRVKELHVQKYPYNDFLYQTYDEEEV